MTKSLRKTRNDLPAKARAAMVDLLNDNLADAIDLRLHTKTAHWNVKGPNFIALHELFDTLAEELEEYIDTTAERAVSLGGTAHGTVRMAAKASRLPELNITDQQGEAFVEALCDRYAALAKSTRNAIDDADNADDVDTSDLFTAFSRWLDKSLWFLEAHLVR